MGPPQLRNKGLHAVQIKQRNDGHRAFLTAAEEPGDNQ